MINIANMSWDDLKAANVKDFLNELEDLNENFFFEFKDDREKPDKLIKEVSAFSNTYGGYVFLGVSDNRTISGCVAWTEERIHNAIYNLMTPVPIFDVKSFMIDEKKILIIKIEEGNNPPYITKHGKIYTRVSSGSMPINDTNGINQLYMKRKDRIQIISKKIELDPIVYTPLLPANLCGYLDVGFSLTCTEETQFQKNFYKWDFSKTCKLLEELKSPFSISCIGDAYLISFGAAIADGGQIIQSGIQNFIEIMYDGSAVFRTILLSESNSSNWGRVNIFSTTALSIIFQKIYRSVIIEPLEKIFLYAHKYEKLQILKQFTPFYKTEGFLSDQKEIAKYQDYNRRHIREYGNNLMIISNRIPKGDYIIYDKRWFQNNNIPFVTDEIINELFYTSFLNLGYMGSIE